MVACSQIKAFKSSEFVGFFGGRRGGVGLVFFVLLFFYVIKMW